MCGLFGLSGKRGNTEFSTLKFAILGAYNDIRGGDSSGAFIDGESSFGIDKTKLFSEFAQEDPLVSQFTGKSVQLALGHCRKASVGAKTILQAQPVVIKNAEGKVEFVMIHNGTLLNHEALKTKYLSKCPDHYTDSQIFAYIVYFKGFKVLTEYEGAGAFVFIDYRPKEPLMYLFKGGSPSYEHGKVLVEERPLFILQKKDALWFSSLKESLAIMQLSKEGIFEPLMNHLYVIKDGVIIDKQLYNRSEKFQMKALYTSTVYPHSGVYNSYKHSDSYYSSKKPNYEKVTTPVIYSCTKLLSYSNLSYSSRKVIFSEGQYMANKAPLHGPVVISEYGYLIESPPIYSALSKTFWFWEGYLLSDAYSFGVIQKMKDLAKEDFTINLIIKYTKNALYDKDTQKFFTKKGKLYSGKYPVYFESQTTEYTVLNGSPVSYTRLSAIGENQLYADYKTSTIETLDEENTKQLCSKAAIKILTSYEIL